MKGVAFWYPSEVSSWMDCRNASSEGSTGRMMRRFERQMLRFVLEAMFAWLPELLLGRLVLLRALLSLKHY